ncbi:MAG: hypothetical protein IAI50_13225 [Candidatus Eremiobacteraeota bacterium]|nr:hypothetical protein [Candidatus Eremiobacteraeota bacterium]
MLANGHGPERRECERLVALLDAPTLADATPAEISCRLPSLNERLVTRIRAGEADAGTTTYEATLAHLEAITQEALSESNPAYRRRASEPVSSVAPVDALLTAWSDVPRTFMRAFPLAVSPVPIAQRFEGWLHLPSVTLEAVYASGNAALATQAGLFGWFAQRLAANPRVPMIAVESAHQAHDLSIAFSDVSAALFELWMWPFRRVEACAADTARLP